MLGRERAKPELRDWAIVLGLVILSIVIISSLTSAHSGPVSGAATVHSQATNRPATPIIHTDKWQESTGQSQMDGSKTVELSVEADDEIRAWIDFHRPVLVLRCMENKTELFVNVGTAASVESGEDPDLHTVRLRIDQNAAFSQEWNESTDRKALFAQEPITLIRKMARGNRLLFQFTPFNASPAIAAFDIRGLDRHIGDLAKDCRWRR